MAETRPGRWVSSISPFHLNCHVSQLISTSSPIATNDRSLLYTSHCYTGNDRGLKTTMTTHQVSLAQMPHLQSNLPPHIIPSHTFAPPVTSITNPQSVRLEAPKQLSQAQ